MRIALVHMRHAHTGGTERYLNHLARYLAERGDDVTIVCRRHEEAPHAAVRFEVLHNLAIGGAWRMSSFARAVERHVAAADYDLVFGLGKTWTHDVIRLGGGCHQTYLDLAHADTLSAAEKLVGKGRLKQKAALAIEARALAPGAYKRVITNCEMVKRDAMERHAIPAELVEVVYNGVDLERFHPRHRADNPVRREAGFGPDDRVVLFLGTGYGRKGLDRVLDAFPAVMSERSDARLLVVGYDGARPSFERRAAALGLGERARFLGGRRDAEVCFGAADVYALPTRYDPFANATLEALATGLPVVTTDANGASELIGEAEGTVLGRGSDAGDVTAALLHWLDRGSNGAPRALAERHSIESKLEATAAILAAVAGEK